MEYSFLINGRFLSQKLTGVHRYAFEMCCALHEIGCKFLVLAPQNILDDYHYSFEVKKIGKLTSHMWEQIELPLYANKHHKKTILISLTGLGSYLHKNNICTIHDLSYLENPLWFSKFYYYFYKFLTPLTAKKALKILTVSNFSKHEIINKLEIHESKIEVIYNAVSENIVNRNPKSITKEKYILSVSSLDPRKNFNRLIEAYNSLKDCDYKLYVVGKNNRVFGDIKLNAEQNANIIFTGYVNDIELAELYCKATLFIYPSLYEGFGIPNLEAMSNNCPVLTSNIPPHKEVCGNAALYFDPEDIHDIAATISNALSNKHVRDELIDKGSKRVLNFSWIDSANKILQIINHLNA